MKLKLLLKISLLCTLVACVIFAVFLSLVLADWHKLSVEATILRVEAIAQPILRLIEQRDAENVLGPDNVSGMSAELSLECRYLVERFHPQGLVHVRMLLRDGTILAHSDPSLVSTQDRSRGLLEQLGWWEPRIFKDEELVHIFLPVLTVEEVNLATLDVALQKSVYLRTFKSFLSKHLGILGGAALFILAGIGLVIFVSVIKPISYLVALGDRMAQGSVIDTTQFAGRNDLFSRLGEVFVNFSAYLQELIELAQNIARGKLDDRKIQKRSKRDLLGVALAEMQDYLRMVAESAGKIAEGDLRTNIPIRTDMDQFGKTLNQMMGYLHQMADVATAVSKGDLREGITPRSEHDILGTAFSNMNAYLERLSTAASAIASGDLQQQVQPVTENDVLGNAFRIMAIQLRENFARIQQEVAERTRAQEALQELNETLEQRVEERAVEVQRQKYILDSFMENVPDGIYFKDRESRFIKANKSLANAFGLDDPAGLEGKSDFDFFTEDLAQLKYQQEQDIIRSGEPILALEEAGAGGLWALSTKMPLRDERGNILGIFGISRDITEMKQAHRQLEDAYVEISTLHDRLKEENIRMGAELDVSRRLQKMVLPLPEELRKVEELDIAGFMQPADEVGGDYYDILPCHDGQFCFGIGDVTGHGLESGVLMLMTQTAVRTLITRGDHEPAEFLSTLNRVLYENIQRMGVDKSLTLSLARYQHGRLKLAGQHEDLLVVRHAGTIERIDTTDLGFPIGMVEDISDWVAEVTVSLEAGDGIVLYTDGITEAQNSTRELYGLDRFCEILSRHWQATSEEIQKAVIDDVIGFIGSHEVYDDLTLVVIKQR